MYIIAKVCGTNVDVEAKVEGFVWREEAVDELAALQVRDGQQFLQQQHRHQCIITR